MHSLAYGQAMAAAARDYQKVRCTILPSLEHVPAKPVHESINLHVERRAGCDPRSTWALWCTSCNKKVIERDVTCFLIVQEMQSESMASAQSHGRDVNVDDLLDDPELERLHAERLAAMQREAEKRVQLQRKGHGELQEV